MSTNFLSLLPLPQGEGAFPQAGAYAASIVPCSIVLAIDQGLPIPPAVILTMMWTLSTLILKQTSGLEMACLLKLSHVYYSWKKKHFFLCLDEFDNVNF